MKKGLFYIITIIFLIAALISIINWGSGPSKPKKITALLDIVLDINDGQEYFIKQFKKLTGITLEINKPPHNIYPEKLKIAFASGDLPDICEIQTGDYIPTASTGQLIALDSFIAGSKNCKLIDKKYYEHYRIKDGKIYGFPVNSGGGCVAYIRKDWLNKLGLKVPSNYSEFYDTIKAFTIKDPDGNNVNDTFGYTLPIKVPPSEIDYYNRFVMHNTGLYYYKKNGKWVDGFSEFEIIPAIERLKKLYEEKLLDQEIFTNTTSTARTKIYDSRAGIMEYWTGIWAKTFNDNTKAKIPSADLIPIPPIIETKYINRVSPCFSITSKCKNPQAVFDNFIDLMWDKGPGQTLFTYGVEDIHYKKSGNSFVMKPSLSNPKNIFQKSYIDSLLAINDMPLKTERLPYELLSDEIQRKYSIQLELAEGKENLQKYGADLNNLKLEILSKIITGKLGVIEGLQRYRERARLLKLDEIIKELNS